MKILLHCCLPLSQWEQIGPNCYEKRVEFSPLRTKFPLQLRFQPCDRLEMPRIESFFFPFGCAGMVQEWHQF